MSSIEVCQNGCLPTSDSQSITPTAQMSDARSRPLPPAAPGAMYASVPGHVALRVSVSASAIRASPKSRSRTDTRSPSASSTFDGFTSRWRIPAACACASPSQICAHASIAAASSSSPARSASRNVSPGTNSYAM